MKKIDLINHVAEAAGLSKVDAAAAVDAVIGGVTDALASGDSVSLVGFGTFSVTERAARIARNPRTGDPINVAASKAPKFKAGKGLKDAVKQG
ncbi:MAG: HU family DNA-binding protein [Ghiorsea sp.]|nr:HU family DNA-binding protein [Ghiorsea sp.]